jgi:NDP-mannose synthase
MGNETVQVVILAGGEGQRLRPYTTVLPKPLMPIGDHAILEILLTQLGRHGFRRVTLAVSYLAELIQASCGDGGRFGVELRYSREPKPLSTAGPLKLLPDLDESFLVVNGDVLTDLDYDAVLDFHRRSGAVATIAAQRRRVEIDFGVVETDGESRLERYLEKPVYEHLVSMGINAFEPRALRYIEPGETLEMPQLMTRLKEAGERVLVYEADCLWLDIGRRDDYERAITLFGERGAELLGGNGVERIRNSKSRPDAPAPAGRRLT